MGKKVQTEMETGSIQEFMGIMVLEVYGVCDLNVSVNHSGSL